MKSVKMVESFIEIAELSKQKKTFFRSFFEYARLFLQQLSGDIPFVHSLLPRKICCSHSWLEKNNFFNLET